MLSMTTVSDLKSDWKLEPQTFTLVAAPIFSILQNANCSCLRISKCRSWRDIYICFSSLVRPPSFSNSKNLLADTTNKQVSPFLPYLTGPRIHYFLTDVINGHHLILLLQQLGILLSNVLPKNTEKAFICLPQLQNYCKNCKPFFTVLR